MKIDVHCHLDFKEFDNDLDKVIERAKKNSFSSIITNSVNLEACKKNINIAKKYDIVKVALGLYPTYAEEISKIELDELLKFIERNKPFAIGEVGLDLYHGRDLDKQKYALKKLIELSIKLDIPIIVHSRKAENETINFLKENKAKKVVLHCFGGNAELTKHAESLGYYFSIPPTIVRNKSFKKLARRISLNRILTETDAPYLSPYENKKRNEPSFIIETIKKISILKGITEEELEKIIFMNYQRLFLE